MDELLAILARIGRDTAAVRGMWMKIAIYGSSLLSSYWNGAATYYRGILRALAPLGHDITFFEPDAFDRQSHRDIDPPPWCRVVVYPATADGVRDVLAQAAAADVVIKASGVGCYDDALLDGMTALARADALRSSGTWTPRRRWRRSRRRRTTRFAEPCRNWMWC